MPTGFFDLPRELRNGIYALVWDSHCPIRLTCGRTVYIGAYYSSPGKNHEGGQVCTCRHWIMTNKCIFTEAVEEFHHKAHIFFHLNLEGRDHATHGSKLEFNPKNVLSPSSARELRIHPQTLACKTATTPDGFDEAAHHHHQLRPEDTSYLNLLMPHLGLSGNIRVLMISLRLRRTHQVPQTIDLSPLAAIGSVAKHLRLFELLVKEELTGTIARETFEKSLKAEVEKLGKTAFEGMAATVEQNRLPGRWQNPQEYFNRWRFAFERV